MNLIVELFVHDGRMKPVGDCPLFPGVIDRDVFCVPVGAFFDVAFLVPHYLPNVGGIAQDRGHGAPAEFRRAVRPGSQEVHLPGDGDAAIAIGVHAIHHSDKVCLRFVDLQGWLFVDGGLPVPIGGVCYIAAVLDGLIQPPAQAFIDDLVFPAGDEGLELCHLIVQLIGEVIGFFRGDDEGPAVFEGVQDHALVPHPAAGQTIQIHAEDGIIAAVLHVLQEPEHLWPGIERLPRDHFIVGLDDVDIVPIRELC